MSDHPEKQLEELLVVAEIEEVIAELIDIEEHILAGTPIPKARKYRYRVNKKHYETEHEEITREQILEKAGMVPVTKYRLFEKKKDQPPVEITPGITVHLRKHGIERFIAQECEVQDGRDVGRRDFVLGAEDVAFLDGIGVNWETIAEDNRLWVVAYGVPVPPGFTTTTVDVAIEISAGYPVSQLDMAYFSPPLVLNSNRAIPQTQTVQRLDGKDWQRWSRHRIGASVWVPGTDNLESHYIYAMQWLARETLR
jgi:hypothetical protein